MLALITAIEQDNKDGTFWPQNMKKMRGHVWKMVHIQKNNIAGYKVWHTTAEFLMFTCNTCDNMIQNEHSFLYIFAVITSINQLVQ